MSDALLIREYQFRGQSSPGSSWGDLIKLDLENFFLFFAVERLEEYLKLLRVSEADLSLEGREALKSLVELALATGLEEGITRSRVIAVVTREQDRILEASQLLEEAREVSRQLEFAIQTVSKRIPQLERSVLNILTCKMRIDKFS